MGSKPSASPKGFGRSPAIVFPGAVKMFTLSALDATGALTRVASFSPFVPSIWYSFRNQTELLSLRITFCSFLNHSFTGVGCRLLNHLGHLSRMRHHGQMIRGQDD